MESQKLEYASFKKNFEILNELIDLIWNDLMQSEDFKW